MKESTGCEKGCWWPGSQGGFSRRMRGLVYQRQDDWAVWGTAVETESADAGCIRNSLMWNLTSIVKARNTGYL